jgi:hypothetical protein
MWSNLPTMTKTQIIVYWSHCIHCYHYVMTVYLSQSDHIKRLLLFQHSFRKFKFWIYFIVKETLYKNSFWLLCMFSGPSTNMSVTRNVILHESCYRITHLNEFVDPKNLWVTYSSSLCVIKSKMERGSDHQISFCQE